MHSNTQFLKKEQNQSYLECGRKKNWFAHVSKLRMCRKKASVCIEANMDFKRPQRENRSEAKLENGFSNLQSNGKEERKKRKEGWILLDKRRNDMLFNGT